MDAAVVQDSPVTGNQPAWKFNWLGPLALVVASFAALSIDISTALVFADKQLPAALDRPLREYLEICEAFGHGFGATVIVIAVGVLDPSRRRCLPWLFGGSLGSGLAANLLKYCVPRTRPRDFDLATGTVWNTFVRGDHTGWGMQSFPSAHTATAVGLAVMLTALYPRGRWFFATLAVLAGLQRIVSTAHFPSDVLAGAAVGWIVANLCANSMIASVGRT